MKKYLMMAAMAALTLCSCNNEAEKVDSAAAPAAKTEAPVQKIAYIEIDSIMTRYKLCVENKAIFEKKGNNIEQTLATKQKALEAAAAKFQQDIQANKYTQQQAQNVQASLQRQSQDLQALQQRLTTEYAREQEAFNKALADSIHNFIARYNKSKKYSMILSKSGDNILYADKAYDVTDEVIAGLNKEYKGEKANKAK